MEDKLKTWLEERNQELTTGRNQMEADRLLLQGRQEAILAVLQQLETLSNESNKPSGTTEQSQPPVAAVNK